MHLAEAGAGPLVVLLHGFPESWYSWRHQLPALAEAGYHAVAPDQRGYGQTDRPPAIDQYTLLHLMGDVVGLLDVLGAPRAVIVGHDLGARVAWHTALFRPDRLRGVAGLSVQYAPRGERRPLSVFRSTFGDRFYQIYFQEPGMAEANLEHDVRQSVRQAFYSVSGENPTLWDEQVRERHGVFGEIEVPEQLPTWLTDADVDYYTAEFSRTGYAGGLNWYRNVDRNWELTAPWHGAKVLPPALHVVGERDITCLRPGAKEAIDNLRSVAPNLTKTIVLQGCGHWTQQERPAEVNRSLIESLRGLPPYQGVQGESLTLEPAKTQPSEGRIPPGPMQADDPLEIVDSRIARS